jgi:hypothetical protein
VYWFSTGFTLSSQSKLSLHFDDVLGIKLELSKTYHRKMTEECDLIQLNNTIEDVVMSDEMKKDDIMNWTTEL